MEELAIGMKGEEAPVADRVTVEPIPEPWSTSELIEERFGFLARSCYDYAAQHPIRTAVVSLVVGGLAGFFIKRNK